MTDSGKLLGDESSATAIPDRLLHRATLIEITGRSSRLKDQTAEAAKADGICDETPFSGGKRA